MGGSVFTYCKHWVPLLSLLLAVSFSASHLSLPVGLSLSVFLSLSVSFSISLFLYLSLSLSFCFCLCLAHLPAMPPPLHHRARRAEDARRSPCSVTALLKSLPVRAGCLGISPWLRGRRPRGLMENEGDSQLLCRSWN